MKLLIATASTQRQDDFFWCDEGELVVFPDICAKGFVGCGCERSFLGLDSRKATTTAMVSEVNIDLKSFLQTIAKSYSMANLPISDADCQKIAGSVIKSVEDFAIGNVLTTRFHKVYLR